MVKVEAGGCWWHPVSAVPADAGWVAGNHSVGGYVDKCVQILPATEAAVLLEGMAQDVYPPGVVVELIENWLEESTGMPLTAVGSLSSAVVSEWVTVRGRLVSAGLFDPLQQLSSLGLLLSYVWSMLAEGCKDDKELQKLRRQVFRPRVRRGTMGNKPRYAELSRAEQQQQAQQLQNFLNPS